VLRDDLSHLALAGYPDNPLRAARLCVTALADELGIDPARALDAAAERVAATLGALAFSSEALEEPRLAWQRTARQETLRALFTCFRDAGEQ
jgi:hypothetical protein